MISNEVAKSNTNKPNKNDSRYNNTEVDSSLIKNEVNNNPNKEELNQNQIKTDAVLSEGPALQTDLMLCILNDRKRHLDDVNSVDEEKPDAKKIKIAPNTNAEINNNNSDNTIFAVPFYVRASSDGIFASYSNNDNPYHLSSLLETKDFNEHLLCNNKAITTSRVLSPIVALVNLQGYLGVPKLIAYKCVVKKHLHQYLIDTTDFAEWPSPMMSLKDMIGQYLTAVKEFHRQCFSLGLQAKVCWKGQEIKFVNWQSCGFRGDTDNSKFTSHPADSCIDMQVIGLTIIDWSKKLSSEEFLPLANILTSSCPFRRLSPELALKVLDKPDLIAKASLTLYPLDTVQQWCDEYELNNGAEIQLKQAARTKRKLQLNIQWHGNIKPSVQYGTYLNEHGQEVQVIGKILKAGIAEDEIPVWAAGLEFSCAQWFSEQKYLPRLLDFEINVSKKKITQVLLIFPQYNTAPRSANVIKMAKQLLTAVKIVHQKRLVHADIAPPNVMWDNNDDLVLIDYGSAYWFNHLDALNDYGSFVVYRTGAHPGFAANEKVRYPVTDVFSAGKLIEYYANEWNQMTPNLRGLIQAMTFQRWYQRISVDEAFERIVQIENDQSHITSMNCIISNEASIVDQVSSQ